MIMNKIKKTNRPSEAAVEVLAVAGDLGRAAPLSNFSALCVKEPFSRVNRL